MKITMSYQDETLNRTIIADEFMEVTEIVELFKAFLLVVGYSQETVDELVVSTTYPRKDSSDERVT